MQRLLRAKYDAGMLKPFNYVKGYARLSAYMDSHLHAAQKQKILRQLDRFRPKFREKVQALTDIELIYVEMWFERSLMEYDRVFASMAIPACCWRRTGEIFRGNKEMAELIHVPIEKLRDVSCAIGVGSIVADYHKRARLLSMRYSRKNHLSITGRNLELLHSIRAKRLC